jgi:hypothetical protein
MTINYAKTAGLILELVRAENFRWTEHYDYISNMQMILPESAGNKKIVLSADFGLSHKTDQYFFWDTDKGGACTEVKLHTGFFGCNTFPTRQFFTPEERREIDYYFHVRLNELKRARFALKQKDDESFFNFFKKLVDKLK